MRIRSPRRSLMALVVLMLAGFGLQAQSPVPVFWDDPEPVLPRSPEGALFPTTVENGTTAIAMWQEKRGTANGWIQSFLTVSVRSTSDSTWTTRQRVLGPFTFTGSPAQFYSAVLTRGGQLYVVVLDEKGQLQMFRSDDLGAHFVLETRLSGTGTLLTPRLFLGKQDQPLLMVTQADSTTFRIAESRKTEGTWTALQVVTDDPLQKQNFQPTVVRHGEDLTLIYQNRVGLNYQIYRKESHDGGLTWEISTRLSDFRDEQFAKPDDVDNQRPTAFWWQEKLYVAWERQSSATLPQILVASFSADGKRTNQYLTDSTFRSRNPQFYLYRNSLRLSWFDNQRINASYDLNASSLDPAEGWGTGEALARDTGDTALGQPVRLGDDLYYFFQINFLDNPNVLRLQPDRRVSVPTLAAVDFDPEHRRNKPQFTVSVGFPRDPSGIQGFNLLVTQDPQAAPLPQRKFGNRDAKQTVSLAQDGLWYAVVIVEDGAGNWSEPTRLAMQLKTTPPGPILMDPPETDAYGFLPSNSPKLTWKPTTADTAAYSWRWSRAGDSLTQALMTSLKPSEPVMSPVGEALAAADNLEDGLWILSVAPYDEAGNRGKTTSFFFRLNKFRATTVISSVEAVQDAFGRIQMVLHGRGFTAGGALTRVYLDRDGQAPFDVELSPSQFRVATDRLVDQIGLEGVPEGIYRVGVLHPERGRVFTGPLLKVEPSGTVKIGDYRNLDQTVWEFFSGVSVFFSITALNFWLVIVLLVLVAVISSRYLLSAWLDRRQWQHQAETLFSDRSDKWAVEARRMAMKTRGLSLRIKFAASILGLTGSVILILSLTLGFFITENSQRTLGTALRQRTQVLLDSMATSVRTYLPSKDTLGLGDLPPLVSAMDGEALYATITGTGSADQPGFSFVWASNDPDLVKKTGSPTLVPGVTQLRDPVEPLWSTLQKKLQPEAAQAVGADALSADDPATVTRIKAKLVQVAGSARSFPEFDPQKLLESTNQKYLFYQPVLNFKKGSDQYVLGLIRIEVSTQAIVRQITASRDQLILLTLVLALIALALGLAGAFVLSALTINPIRKLVAGVAKIRDTQDKTELYDHIIDIRTRDELEDLAATVNQMTRGLVDGASRTQDLTKGKVEQKTLFIPLDVDQDSKQKLTTFHRDLDDIEVFAYYEGAKLVSGDLYEFRQLDTQNGKNPHSPWYGIMKGDVSGKGVEAGMIMAIAAMFVTTFFRGWVATRDARDTKVDKLLYQVNDTIEPILAEAGRGLFVALNVGILNAKTGALRFSQAGDNLLHIWRGSQQHFESVDLKKTVSVGAMPSGDHAIRYENRDLKLQSGDTLLYFTDGVEESQATYRDANWQPIAYFDPEDPTTVTVPGDRKQVPAFEGGPLRDIQAIATEDFGPERIEAVITAYQNRQVYELRKKNSVPGAGVYHFDFRDTDGSAQTLVTALISIDRVFRIIPDPKATEDDFIDLDLVQDEFLKKYMIEYAQYFHDGFRTYEQGDRSKGDIVDAQGYRIKGSRRIPLWQKGNPAQGDAVDSEGYKIVDDDRVPQWEMADSHAGDARDPEGFKLVNGRRVPSYVRANVADGDLMDGEGYKVVGGGRVQQNPGYIRFNRLKEDHQFDDLTLLAIRKK